MHDLCVYVLVWVLLRPLGLVFLHGSRTHVNAGDHARGRAPVRGHDHALKIFSKAPRDRPTTYHGGKLH